MKAGADNTYRKNPAKPNQRATGNLGETGEQAAHIVTCALAHPVPR